MHERDIAVDPIILGELRYGILILPKGKKRTDLERWFEAGAASLHCLQWDSATVSNGQNYSRVSELQEKAMLI